MFKISDKTVKFLQT